ncbi:MULTISPECIES: restriction endonuclease subunit S [unclassified Bacteroides]|uniref:restriction endonuclease subunit S n=1 Tax=unclassified Bacteroides TaxID=2646097 RepID=UPI0005590EEF|nr:MULTISPECIES: restriction endonuclease subunit S [unclassified Bacteroides]
MKGLQQLINQLCPNGVEWKSLGEVCHTITTGRLNANAMVENGIYPFFTCDKKVFTINSYAFDCEAILVSGNGSQVGHINYYKGKFNAYQRTYVLTDLIGIAYPFLLHYFHSYLKDYILANCKKGAVPYITLPMLQDFPIPLPPLAIQSRIVEILDHFTNLTANLTAELALRSKQFEHFREKLLSLDGVDGVEWKTLGEVAEYSKSRIESKELNNDNYVSVENLLQNKKGKVKSECCPVTGNWIKFVVGDVLIGNIRPYLRKIWLADSIGGTNGDVLAIHIKNRKELYPEYLYYVLSSEDFFIYDTDNSKGAKMPRGDKKAILAYTIPVPPLAVQHSIVEKLDKFTALILNIENELALRQKQYEYYREKLLSFPSPSL